MWDPRTASAGPPWGPGAPPPVRPPSPGGAATTLVGSAIALGLGALVAIGSVVAGDLPGDYFSDDLFLSMVAILAVAAAPVALLLSWDEIDLSCIGAVGLGGYLYVEVGDGTVLLGLFAAAVAGLVAGAILGLVRWLTGAHSALLSLGAGAVLTGLSTLASPGAVGMSVQDGRIDGAGLPMLAMLVVVGAAVLLGALLRDDAAPAGAPARTPGLAGPRVVPAFALSGMAGMLFGALQSGVIGYYQGGAFPYIPIVIFTAVAVGGVVRGSGPVGPIAAAVAAGFVTVVQDAARSHGWDAGDVQLVLGVLLVVCAAAAYGVRRLTTPASRPGLAPGAPF